MSVVRSKRGQSGMVFIDNDRELEIYTIQRVAHFPKQSSMWHFVKEIQNG